MTPLDRIKASLATLVAELVGERARYLGLYTYRVVKGEAGKVTGQPTSKALGLPDLVDVPLLTLPGVDAEDVKIAPGTIAVVAFLNGEPSAPRVISVDATTSLQAAIKATTKAKINAASVEVNGGTLPVARQTDTILAGGIFAGTITSGSPTFKSG